MPKWHIWGWPALNPIIAQHEARPEGVALRNVRRGLKFCVIVCSVCWADKDAMGQGLSVCHRPRGVCNIGVAHSRC